MAIALEKSDARFEVSGHDNTMYELPCAKVIRGHLKSLT